MENERGQCRNSQPSSTSTQCFQFGFVSTSLPRTPFTSAAQVQCCSAQNNDVPIRTKPSRRAFFKIAIGTALIYSSGVLRDPAIGEEEVKEELIADAAEEKSEGGCRNCQGGGKITCELCSGTGFWRALSGNDPNQRYKGVVCPECEGVGILTCPVCLGTGEGNIKGLLRRRRVEPGPGRILQST